MKDFGAKVKAAEREVKAKAHVAQSSKKSEAPYGFKKDGTPYKRPPSVGRWKPGESGNPEKTWKPGESGNPGGKPQKTPITDAMRELLRQPYTGKEAKYKGKTNAEVMALRQFELAIESGDLSAQKEIADRVEGKVPQRQEHGGPDGGAIPFMNLSREENERRLAELTAKASGVKDGDSAN